MDVAINRSEDNTRKIVNVFFMSILFAALSCIITIAIHVFNSAFIQGVHGKPQFVSNMLFAYSTAEKILFAIGYVVLGRKLPIKNGVLRGFTYMMLIWASDYMPQIMGLAGADSNIAKEAFSLSIIACDTLGYILSGVILGIIFRKAPNTNVKSCKKHATIKTAIISAITFPVLVIIVDQLIARVYPPFSSAVAMGVSEENRMIFFSIFYSCFIVSGTLIAIFYRFTEYNDGGQKAWLGFGLKYSMLIWSPVVLIMIIFGVDVVPTIAYTLIFIFCISILSWIDDNLLTSK